MIAPRAAAIVLFAFTMPSWVSRFTRETNSAAATSRGLAAYEQAKKTNKLDPAIEEFKTANSLRPTPDTAFNLGTSQIAAGKRDEGGEAITPAINDPRTRADALYNRGNGALAVKAYEDAIRDYTDVLRLRSDDKNAKRNLEIALKQKEEDEKEKEKQKQAAQMKGKGGGPGQQKNQSGGATQPKEKLPGGKEGQTAGGSNDSKQKGQQAILALLRAIQQQEGEELQRMKRVRSEGQKIGW